MRPLRQNPGDRQFAGVAAERLRQRQIGVDAGEIALPVKPGEARIAAPEIARPPAPRCRAPCPPSAPRATGEKATKATPSSRQACNIPSSGARVHSEYSDCMAAIGWTACARRSVSGAISDRPIAPILPASTWRASAPTVSSIGKARIEAMHIIEIDMVDAEALQRGVERGDHMRLAIVDEALALGVAGDAEFGGERHARPPRAVLGQEPPDAVLALAEAIGVSGVEEIDAEIQRARRATAAPRPRSPGRRSLKGSCSRGRRGERRFCRGDAESCGSLAVGMRGANGLWRGGQGRAVPDNRGLWFFSGFGSEL